MRSSESNRRHGRISHGMLVGKRLEEARHGRLGPEEHEHPLGLRRSEKVVGDVVTRKWRVACTHEPALRRGPSRRPQFTFPGSLLRMRMGLNSALTSFPLVRNPIASVVISVRLLRAKCEKPRQGILRSTSALLRLRQSKAQAQGDTELPPISQACSNKFVAVRSSRMTRPDNKFEDRSLRHRTSPPSFHSPCQACIRLPLCGGTWSSSRAARFHPCIGGCSRTLL